MRRRRLLIPLGGLLAALLAIGVLFSRAASRPVGPHPPELGGQRVPEAIYDIRFDRPYDVFCTFFSEAPTIYRNCKIVGFTGRDKSTGAGQGSEVGIFSASSGSGSGYSYREHFDHWLVLKLDDGRLAYVPPEAVRYIEEATPKGR